jgi:hypothetical protein
MTNKLHSHAQRVRATRLASLALAGAVTAVSAFAMANAQSGASHQVRPEKAKTCSSQSGCLQATNQSSGPGVLGINAATGYGVLGESLGSNAGVGGFNSATSTGASGVYGQSANGPGLNGYSTNSYSVWAQGSGSQNNVPLVLTQPSGSGYVWFASNNLTATFQFLGGLTSLGDLDIPGQIFTGGSCRDGCTRTRREATFASRSSQPTLDDVGEATLRNGAARVSLDPAFANVVDLAKPYVVLLTTEGDAALYVASRTPSAFEVREVGGGHSMVSFAYRIVAKPYGVPDERLPFRTVAAPHR